MSEGLGAGPCFPMFACHMIFGRSMNDTLGNLKDVSDIYWKGGGISRMVPCIICGQGQKGI